MTWSYAASWRMVNHGVPLAMPSALASYDRETTHPSLFHKRLPGYLRVEYGFAGCVEVIGVGEHNWMLLHTGVRHGAIPTLRAGRHPDAWE